MKQDDQNPISALLANKSAEARDNFLDKVLRIDRGTMRENQRIHDAAFPLIGKPVSEWPRFELKWDLRPGAQHKALDAVSQKAFRQMHPDPPLLAWVDMAELDSKLTPFCRRTPEEVWGPGSDVSAAALIVRWSEGVAITPPFSRTYEGQVSLYGGHHRLAVARAKGAQRVPALILPHELDVLSAILISLVVEENCA